MKAAQAVATGGLYRVQKQKSFQTREAWNQTPGQIVFQSSFIFSNTNQCQYKKKQKNSGVLYEMRSKVFGMRILMRRQGRLYLLFLINVNILKPAGFLCLSPRLKSRSRHFSGFKQIVQGGNNRLYSPRNWYDVDNSGRMNHGFCSNCTTKPLELMELSPSKQLLRHRVQQLSLVSVKSSFE